MKSVQLKIESIKVHESMRKWVDKQNKNEKPSILKMRREIGIDWSSDYFPYCKIYINGKCNICPMRLRGKIEFCCGGFWDKVAKVKTWGQWIECSENLVEEIKKSGRHVLDNSNNVFDNSNIRIESVKIKNDLIILEERMKNILETGEMTQQEFVEKVGGGQAWVSRWYRGKIQTDCRQILKMAERLGL